MAHYFQGGYQSRAQRLRICIEAASILHAACAASWLHHAACRTGQVCVWGRASSWCPTARRMLRTCCTCSVGCSLCFVLPLCFCVCFEAQVFCVCSGFQPWLFRSVTGSASITLGNTSKGGAPRRTPATETLLQKDVHSSELLDNSCLNRWSLCEAKEEARSANRGHGVLDSGPCSSSMWSP